MGKRKVHLRPYQVITLGRTATKCGRVLYTAPQDTSGAVVAFNAGSIDVTMHFVLTTCAVCRRKA